MKDLVKIQTNADGKKAVSAKEMYLGLGLNPTQWKRWANKNIEKNPFAVGGVDWLGFDIMSSGNKTKDYILTLDFAKKLCMQARTQRGEDLRNYFLEVEKVAMSQTAPMIDGAKLAELENKINRLTASTIGTEVNEFSIHGYCGLHKIKVSINEATALGKLASKKCREQNEPIGKIRDFRFGLVNLYPESVLKVTFEEFFKKPRF
ncbi:MAG: antA/AntB antirepressor family protein [Bacteroidia bacterium]|nr:antA/AntB antirepressor family protein [Bacteroidia bacterium]